MIFLQKLQVEIPPRLSFPPGIGGLGVRLGSGVAKGNRGTPRNSKICKV